MRAQHEVDLIGMEARVLEVGQKVAAHVREDVELALAVGADASVEHDSVLARAHHETLERDDHLALRRRVVGLQPRIREHGLRRRVRQQQRDVVFPGVDLDDARDLDVADLPGTHRLDGHQSYFPGARGGSDDSEWQAPVITDLAPRRHSAERYSARTQYPHARSGLRFLPLLSRASGPFLPGKAAS